VRIRALSILSAMILTASGAWAIAIRSDGFPHAEHEGLFPLCEGCHSGIETGDEGSFFPSADGCVRCHDGEREERVEWAEPARTASNLAFSHDDHATRVRENGDSATCSACHLEPGSTERMAVVRPAAETCLECHAHEAPEHLGEVRDCAVCHVPLTDAKDLSGARISDFETPPGHDDDDFVSRHAPESDRALRSCRTCHARESCTRCHMNGDDLAAVTALTGDRRVAAVVAEKAPEYPKPDTHESKEWSWRHGAAADDDAPGCANCHATDSCTVCHEGGQASSVAVLPTAPQEDPRGVRLPIEPIVHDAGFMVSHEARAAAAPSACESCHTGSFCEACHDGPTKPRFHFGNFLQMHAPEAWGNEVECATCHNPDVFCRGCHSGMGLASEGRLDVAYHSRSPFWLFGHGTAARQGLESCRTCHAQADCTRCHAAVGSWRINPHGPGFEAERLKEANPTSCFICHRTGIPPS